MREDGSGLEGERGADWRRRVGIAPEMGVRVGGAVLDESCGAAEVERMGVGGSRRGGGG